MTIANVLTVFFVIVGVLVAFPGMWLTLRATCGKTVDGATRACERSLLKCFFVGLPVSGILLLLMSVATKALGAAGQAAGIVFLCILIIVSHLGVAGFVGMIGNRLKSPADDERPWKATVRGGIALELSWLLPVVGWFAILPISMIIGTGAALLAVFSRGSQDRFIPSPVVDAPAPARSRSEVE